MYIFKKIKINTDAAKVIIAFGKSAGSVEKALTKMWYIENRLNAEALRYLITKFSDSEKSLENVLKALENGRLSNVLDKLKASDIKTILINLSKSTKSDATFQKMKTIFGNFKLLEKLDENDKKFVENLKCSATAHGAVEMLYTLFDSAIDSVKNTFGYNDAGGSKNDGDNFEDMENDYMNVMKNYHIDGDL